MKSLRLVPVLLLCSFGLAQAQQKENQTAAKTNNPMKTYVIERIIPGAGDLTPEQLQGISKTSCTVLEEMSPSIVWQHSYVTGDKVYCVYKAENKALIEEHAKKGNFPANAISEVAATIGPETAKP